LDVLLPIKKDENLVRSEKSCRDETENTQQKGRIGNIHSNHDKIF
jgi:hypothetical protein